MTIQQKTGNACAERRRVCSGSVSRKVTPSWLVAEKPNGIILSNYYGKIK